MPSRAALIAMLTIAASLLVSACGGAATPAQPTAPAPPAATAPATQSTSASASTGPKDKVRLGLVQAKVFGYLPAYALVDWGIQDKYNLDVEIMTFNGSAPAHQAIAAGGVDIVGAAATDILGAAAKGVPEKFVAQIDKDLRTIVLIGDKNISSVDELKGKNVGVASSGGILQWLVDKLNQTKGWTGENAMKAVALGGPDNMLAALKQGQIAGFAFTIDTGYRLEAAGEAKILLGFEQVVPKMPFEFLSASNDIIEKHPDVVQRTINAFFDAAMVMSKDKARTVDLAQKRLGVSKEIAERVYSVDIASRVPDGQMSADGLREVAQGLVDLEMTPQLVDASKFVTTQFVPAKIKE